MQNPHIIRQTMPLMIFFLFKLNTKYIYQLSYYVLRLKFYLLIKT